MQCKIASALCPTQAWAETSPCGGWRDCRAEHGSEDCILLPLSKARENGLAAGLCFFTWLGTFRVLCWLQLLLGQESKGWPSQGLDRRFSEGPVGCPHLIVFSCQSLFLPCPQWYASPASCWQSQLTQVQLLLVPQELPTSSKANPWKCRLLHHCPFSALPFLSSALCLAQQGTGTD